MVTRLALLHPAVAVAAAVVGDLVGVLRRAGARAPRRWCGPRRRRGACPPAASNFTLTPSLRVTRVLRDLADARRVRGDRRRGARPCGLRPRTSRAARWPSCVCPGSILPKTSSLLSKSALSLLVVARRRKAGCLPLFLTVTLSVIGSPARDVGVRRDRSRPSPRSPWGRRPAPVGRRVGPVDAELRELVRDLGPLFACATCAMKSLAARTCSRRLPAGIAATRSRANLIGKSGAKVSSSGSPPRSRIASRSCSGGCSARAPAACPPRRARVRQVLREIALAQPPCAATVEVHLQRVDRHRVELDVRRDADALDRDVARA